MKLAILFTFAALAAAQTVTVTGTGPVRPGQTIEIAVELTDSSNPAGVQWTAGLPANWPVAATAGPVATAVGKTLYCTEDKRTCLVVGLNANTLGNGEIARYALTVPAGTAPGTYQVPLTGLLAGSAAAIAQPIQPGAVFEIRVLAGADINGDGVVTMADVFLMIDMALSRTACTADQNGDGQCNLLDVLLVLRDATP